MWGNSQDILLSPVVIQRYVKAETKEEDLAVINLIKTND
ncbi:hypothetical protein BVRB_8g186970 [Beta vulgaris subsp. vulgaris]|nr:hypothetical protein BVRB_8g186970 [Beta vulgaris subsp. vulgaris]